MRGARPDQASANSSLALEDKTPPLQDIPIPPASTEAVPVVPASAAIPDGGLRAWLQVVGSFFLFFNSWGIVNTFGTYQAYYKVDLLASSNPSAISWIGSIQAFLLMVIGVLTGPIYDAGYFRTLVATGSFLIVFGQMMLSLCTEYWQVLLAQGICIGLGTGCLFVPSVAILSTYFRRHLAAATGIAASGSSLGGVIYPIMFHKLQPVIGFPWASRVIGFVMLGTMVLPNIVMKMRILPAARRSILDFKAFRETPYTLFVVGAFFSFIGLYAPFFYVQLYAIQNNISSVDFAFYLLSIMNAGSVFGRVIPNIIADILGPFNIMIPCVLLAAILLLCLMAIKSIAPLIVFCILYGFFSGTFVSLPPTILVSLSPSLGVIGTRMGMCFAITAIGILIGSPIAGAILDSHGFNAMWIFAGVSTLVGSCILVFSRGLHVGWSLKTKG